MRTIFSVLLLSTALTACGPALPEGVTTHGKLASSISVTENKDLVSNLTSRTLTVTLSDAQGHDVTDAIVKVSPGGTAVYDSENANFARYHLEKLPDSGEYKVEIERGGDFIRATVKMPAAFTFTTEPQALKPNQEFAFTWAPNNEQDVLAVPSVIKLDPMDIRSVGHLPDSGRYSPATSAIDAPATYQLSVSRQWSQQWRCMDHADGSQTFCTLTGNRLYTRDVEVQ